MLRQFYLIAKKPNAIKNTRDLVSEINGMSLKEAASNLLGVHHSFVLSHGLALRRLSPTVCARIIPACAPLTHALMACLRRVAGRCRCTNGNWLSVSGQHAF